MTRVSSQNIREEYVVPSIPSVVIFPGVACGSATQSTQNWLEVNLGNFSKYAEYQDLVTWNKHFVAVSMFNFFFSLASTVRTWRCSTMKHTTLPAFAMHLQCLYAPRSMRGDGSFSIKNTLALVSNYHKRFYCFSLASGTCRATVIFRNGIVHILMENGLYKSCVHASLADLS